MKEPQAIRRLFEYLPGVCFFVKDRESRLIAGNQLLLDRLGLKSEAELIGTCDADHFPPEVCAAIVNDDQQVFQSGQPIVGRVELGYNARRILDWYTTTKLPILGQDDEVIGLCGFTRLYEKASLPGPASGYAGLEESVDLIRRNPNRRVNSEEMAKAAGISVSQLRRRFRQTFGMTPREFEQVSRIQGASQALIESDSTIAEIAVDFGFYDQSAFSVQFRKHTGYTPGEYRQLRTQTHNAILQNH